MQEKSEVKRDEAILEVVLQDLLTLKEKGLPFSLPPAPREIFFNPDSCKYLKDKPQEVLEHWGAWKKLSATERRAVGQATTQLTARKTEQGVFAHYRPQHPKIKIIRIKERGGHAKPYQANYPLHAGAPGFTNDGQYAVLTLFFPEFLHSSNGAYILTRRRGYWEVLCRGFVTYA